MRLFAAPGSSWRVLLAAGTAGCIAASPRGDPCVCAWAHCVCGQAFEGWASGAACRDVSAALHSPPGAPATYVACMHRVTPSLAVVALPCWRPSSLMRLFAAPGSSWRVLLAAGTAGCIAASPRGDPCVCAWAHCVCGQAFEGWASGAACRDVSAALHSPPGAPATYVACMHRVTPSSSAAAARPWALYAGGKALVSGSAGG